MNLSAQYETLKEENRQLRAMLVTPDFKTPQHWGLSASEDRMLSSLYSAPVGGRPKEALKTASCISTHADVKVVEVRISKMRQKLRPFGVEIHTVWGFGYELTPASVQIIKEAASC